MNEKIERRLLHYQSTVRRNGGRRFYPPARDPRFVYRYVENFYEAYGWLPPRGWHIHHIDNNKKNSDPDNLIALPRVVHEWCHRQRYQPSRRELNRHVDLWQSMEEVTNEHATTYFDSTLYSFWPDIKTAMDHFSRGMNQEHASPGWLREEWGLCSTKGNGIPF